VGSCDEQIHLEVHFIGKNTEFPPFWRLKSFFSYFRILVIQEIDFWDFGNSGNQILDIGFRILTVRILTFGILTFRIFDGNPSIRGFRVNKQKKKS